MTDTIRSLCSNCKKNCPTYLKTELALRRNLTYIYLNNGNKIINICNQFSEGKVQRNINKFETPVLEESIASNPPKLNFKGNVNLANFMSLAAKI